MSSILVVGSVAYDSISTPSGSRERILGGSANYFSLAASLFAPVRVVGVVGEDYQDQDLDLLKKRGIDIAGLQKVKGETFTWAGRYEKDMNEAITLATHLNVFENFHPEIPAGYRNSEVVFLANIDPTLQLQVLEQVQRPRLVAADTMNYWIHSKKSELLKVLSKIDVLLINEGELHELTGSWNTIRGAKEIMAMGPRSVVIKRGEYGFVLFNESRYFILPAFPVEDVVDPTGAGDTFAGGFLGYLAKIGRVPSREDLKQACQFGCLLASFTVQDFGLEAIRKVSLAEVDQRFQAYRQVIS
ncbi:MAG: PfkB family carbohydrate kinase [Bdellovibrionales bacterium]